MEVNVVSRGAMSCPLIGVVGVWDPPVLQHSVLFGNIAKYAAERALSSLVVTLDPDPAVYALGQESRIT